MRSRALLFTNIESSVLSSSSEAIYWNLGACRHPRYAFTLSRFVTMLMNALTKSYVLDENQIPIAVQIPIAEFEHLEEILENYGLLQLMAETRDSDHLTKADAIEYYNALKKRHVES